MIAVFNAITNIAKDIRKNVFVDCEGFINNSINNEKINQKLHSYYSNVIKREFNKTKSIHSYIGKRHKNLKTNNENGKYIISYVCIDNIDLFDINFSLGSIFGIYERQIDALHLKAAIYITYGPAFQLVFASKTDGIQYFRFENEELIEQDSPLLQKEGKINSTASLASEWTKEHKNLIDKFFNKGYRLRFSDSLALDTHQILLKRGGLYSCPATKSFPNGKLSTVFEAFPISCIIEQAGGRAINEQGRILDITATDINAKTPIYFGSINEIKQVQEYLNKHR